MTTSDDYGSCPLPTTHRRLVDAHVLWHQALGSYSQADRFRANLNALLQALRNVTFALQSEKARIPDFEAWYASWEQRLRSDTLASWVKDSRNVVVKQGDLETSSTAVVRLLTWRDEVLAEVAAPPETPASVILGNLPLLELIAGLDLPRADAVHAAITIERKWSVPELGGREILEALGQVYGLLSTLVLAAHVHLRSTGCVPAGDVTHSHFVSTHQRSGLLECMAVGAEVRTERFTAAGEELVPAGARATGGSRPGDGPARAGLARDDRLADWEESDPVLVARRVLFQAKRVLRRDKQHPRVVYVRDGVGRWHALAIDARNRTEKHLLMRMVAGYVERVGADALIDVGEVWMLTPEQARGLRDLEQIGATPGRREGLQVLLATRDGVLQSHHTPFVRGPLGGIRLGDTVLVDDETPFYLTPIVEVWRRHGTITTPTGQTRRRVWEPDPRDNCFCGSGRHFGVCCEPNLNRTTGARVTAADFDHAAAARDWPEALRCAAALLAQYVIWIRQHTAPTRHVAEELHRDLVKLDVPALDVHMHQLKEALQGIGNPQEYPERLRRISRVVGVPEVSVRVIAATASYLVECDEDAAAILELERLGDIDNISDTRALLVTATLSSGDPREQGRLLERAVSCALDAAERGVAELYLARWLTMNGKQHEASAIVDSLIASTKDDHTRAGVYAGACQVRWNITRAEEDYRAARKALTVLADPEHRRELAMLLIDHGELEEAGAILSELVDDGVMTGMLRVDIALRSGRPSAAREAFDQIPADKVQPRHRYPYLHCLALVSLATGDRQLQRRAYSELREFVSNGPELAASGPGTELVEGLIDTLRRALEGAQ